MIKYICFKLNKDDEKNIKNIEYLLDNCFEIRCSDEQEFIRLESDIGKDGSRYIIMNNDTDICVGYHSATATLQCSQDFNIDLEKLLFTKIRRELDFERKY